MSEDGDEPRSRRGETRCLLSFAHPHGCGTIINSSLKIVGCSARFPRRRGGEREGEGEREREKRREVRRTSGTSDARQWVPLVERVICYSGRSYPRRPLRPGNRSVLFIIACRNRSLRARTRPESPLAS
jgi:hypothetical protein